MLLGRWLLLMGGGWGGERGGCVCRLDWIDMVSVI